MTEILYIYWIQTVNTVTLKMYTFFKLKINTVKKICLTSPYLSPHSPDAQETKWPVLKKVALHLLLPVAIVFEHSSLVRHGHTHFIDFHLDNLMFTDHSKPHHHRHSTLSLGIQACLTVFCHYISSLTLFFLSRFIFPKLNQFRNKQDINGVRMRHQSISLHTNTHAVQIHFPPTVFLFPPPTYHYLLVVGQSNRNKNCTPNIIS